MNSSANKNRSSSPIDDIKFDGPDGIAKENDENNNLNNMEKIKKLNENKEETKDLRFQTATEIVASENKIYKPRRFSMISSKTSSINFNDNTSVNSISNTTTAITTTISTVNATTATKKSNLMSNIFSLNQSTGINLSNNNLSTLTPVNSTQQQNNESQSMQQYGVETTNYNELHAIMQKINTWGIEVFLLDELTMHHPLTAVTYTIFQVNLINLKKISSCLHIHDYIYLET